MKQNKIKTFFMALFIAVFLCGCDDNNAQTHDIMTQMSENDLAEDSSYVRGGQEDAEKQQISQTLPEKNYVYICGAVKSPGVYKVDNHSRLFEVIDMAGGFDDAADRAYLNLAREVEDGEKIVVLTADEAAEIKEKGMCGELPPDEDDGLVNINTASVSELTLISGIGESRAQAIISYRESNGGFKTIEDIKKVDGIKDGLFLKIKDKIKV